MRVAIYAVIIGLLVSAWGGPAASSSSQTSDDPLSLSTSESPPSSVAVPVPPTKVKKPKPATRTSRAKNVPHMPMDSGSGRRIVYDKSLMTVWIMNSKNEVEHRFRVTGRWDRPKAGVYRIYSKSEKSKNVESQVTYDHMTRFARGNDGVTPIGFHSIPLTYSGYPIQTKAALGLPLARGGCVRMDDDQAELLYEWAKIGDRVVVLAPPDA